MQIAHPILNNFRHLFKIRDVYIHNHVLLDANMQNLKFRGKMEEKLDYLYFWINLFLENKARILLLVLAYKTIMQNMSHNLTFLFHI